MMKIAALFTAIAVALSLGIAFAQEKDPAVPRVDRKTEGKVPVKKQKKAARISAKKTAKKPSAAAPASRRK